MLHHAGKSFTHACRKDTAIDDFAKVYPEADPDDLIEGEKILIQRYSKAWNENLNSELGPHYYFAKEFWYCLKGRNSVPIPSYLILFAQLFSSYTVTIAEFLTEVLKICDVE